MRYVGLFYALCDGILSIVGKFVDTLHGDTLNDMLIRAEKASARNSHVLNV